MIKIKLIVITIFTAIAMAISPFVSAEDVVQGSGPNIYVECGIGGALFPNTHWAAISSNVIWDLGTTALTSATASPETCSAKKAKTAQFIFDNYDNLAEETAKGQGDHIVALFNVLGCQASAHRNIIAAVRLDMAKVVGQPSYTDQNIVMKASDYYNVVNSAVEGKFANSCSV